MLRPAWNHDSVGLTDAPYPLAKIMNNDATQIDIRRLLPGDRFPSTGDYYWRTPLSYKLLLTHIEELNMAPISPDPDNKAVMMGRFPKDWQPPSGNQLHWFAGMHNHEKDQNLGSWFIMIVCREKKTIYFFHSTWDYTP